MQFRHIGWFRPLLALCALLLFSCAGMQAQRTTADFGGAVADSTGAVIPHAQITLIETGTHTVRKAQSSDDGAYAFNQIQPGLYNLKIEAKGFNSFAVSGIQVSAGAHPRLDARLNIGQTEGTPGDEVRNQIEAPRDRRVDLSLFKNFPVYREATLQFRAECYNISNTPNFGLPSAQGSFASNDPNTGAGFGVISNTIPNELPRQWQFALKLKF